MPFNLKEYEISRFISQGEDQRPPKVKPTVNPELEQHLRVLELTIDQLTLENVTGARNKLAMEINVAAVQNNPEAIERFKEINQAFAYLKGYLNPAMSAAITPGGIDLNAANLAMVIKRDGKGMVLPVAEQDLAEISRTLTGFDPQIIEIQPAVNVPILNEIKTTVGSH